MVVFQYRYRSLTNSRWCVAVKQPLLHERERRERSMSNERENVDEKRKPPPLPRLSSPVRGRHQGQGVIPPRRISSLRPGTPQLRVKSCLYQSEAPGPRVFLIHVHRPFPPGRTRISINRAAASVAKKKKEKSFRARSWIYAFLRGWEISSKSEEGRKEEILRGKGGRGWWGRMSLIIWVSSKLGIVDWACSILSRNFICWDVYFVFSNNLFIIHTEFQYFSASCTFWMSIKNYIISWNFPNNCESFFEKCEC